MNKKIRVLPDNFTYREYYAFMSAFRVGNTRELFRIAQNMIVSWDYDVDLATPEALMELGVEESGEVVRTLMEMLGEFTESIDIEGIEVNFRKWNTRAFMEFDEWRRVGNFDKAEPALFDIVKYDELEKYRDGTHLPFPLAAAVFKAINEKYKKVVSGKN